MRYLARAFLWLCWAFLIFLTTSAPGGEGGAETAYHLDLFVHFLWFAVFAVLTLYVLAPYPRLRPALRLLFALVLSFSYAGLVEYYQAYIPGRSPSALDLAAGAAGAAVSVIIGRRFL